jgi:hypothetical protein
MLAKPFIAVFRTSRPASARLWPVRRSVSVVGIELVGVVVVIGDKPTG